MPKFTNFIDPLKTDVQMDGPTLIIKRLCLLKILGGLKANNSDYSKKSYITVLIAFRLNVHNHNSLKAKLLYR